MPGKNLFNMSTLNILADIFCLAQTIFLLLHVDSIVTCFVIKKLYNLKTKPMV